MMSPPPPNSTCKYANVFYVWYLLVRIQCSYLCIHAFAARQQTQGNEITLILHFTIKSPGKVISKAQAELNDNISDVIRHVIGSTIVQCCVLSILNFLTKPPGIHIAVVQARLAWFKAETATNIWPSLLLYIVGYPWWTHRFTTQICWMERSAKTSLWVIDDDYYKKKVFNKLFMHIPSKFRIDNQLSMNILKFVFSMLLTEGCINCHFPLVAPAVLTAAWVLHGTSKIAPSIINSRLEVDITVHAETRFVWDRQKAGIFLPTFSETFLLVCDINFVYCIVNVGWFKASNIWAFF